MTRDAQAPLPSDDTAPPTVPGPAPDADPEAIAAARRGLLLVDLAREIERHVAAQGWDQNPRLFALARTSELVALEPELAPALGDAVDDPDSLTPIEQEPLDRDRALEDVLATTMWPDEVAGAAIVLERVVLPPSAEAALPDDDPERLEAVALEHPERQDVRMAVVVTRDGRRACALRLRSHDADDEVLVGDDLVPQLADALAATLT